MNNNIPILTIIIQGDIIYSVLLMEEKMNCVNCGTPLEEGINLCPNCGKEYLICVKCGSHNDINSDLCIQCGNSFNNDIFRTVTNNRVFKLDELISKKRKPLIYAVIAACVLSVFCLVILVKTILPDKNSGLENIFYIKNAVLYRRGSNNKTIKLSDIKTPQKKILKYRRKSQDK